MDNLFRYFDEDIIQLLRNRILYLFYYMDFFKLGYSFDTEYLYLDNEEHFLQEGWHCNSIDYYLGNSIGEGQVLNNDDIRNWEELNNKYGVKIPKPNSDASFYDEYIGFTIIIKNEDTENIALNSDNTDLELSKILEDKTFIKNIDIDNYDCVVDEVQLLFLKEKQSLYVIVPGSIMLMIDFLNYYIDILRELREVSKCLKK